MKQKTKYIALSPDGFSILRDRHFNTRESAQNAIEKWAKQYERQGYYSTSNRDRIALEDIVKHCKIIER